MKKTVHHNGKHTLTDAERYEMTMDLTRASLEIPRLEEQKTAIASEFKSKIDNKKAECTRLATIIEHGYDYRAQECTVVYNMKTKRKEYYSVDDGTMIDDERMTAEDFQMQIDEANEAAQATIQESEERK